MKSFSDLTPQHQTLVALADCSVMAFPRGTHKASLANRLRDVGCARVRTITHTHIIVGCTDYGRAVAQEIRKGLNNAS